MVPPNKTGNSINARIDVPKQPSESGESGSSAAEGSAAKGSATVAEVELDEQVEAGTEETAAEKSDSLAKRIFKRPSKLVVLWASLLLGGSAIAYFNFSQNAPRSLSPTGAQLVPQSALATVTLTTDELTWTKLRQFGTPETQEQFDELLNQWKAQLFTANGYSFKRDIKPWIGDRVTLAFLPSQLDDRSDASSDTNSGVSAQNGGLAAAAQNLVLVIPIADAAKAEALLKSDSMALSTEARSYKGFSVQTITGSNEQTFESTVIGSDWLLLSNTAEGIEQAIDTHKGRRSLLDSAGYRKAATRVESPQPRGKNFAQIYLNIPAATEAMAPPEGTTNRPNGSLVPLQGSEGIVATALVESEGIRFQGTSWLSPKNDLAYNGLQNEASEMPGRLPGNTLLTMTGSNLQQSWQSFSESNTSPPFFPNPQNLKAGLLTQTGLDIDEDIMPWAAGEFALGLLSPVAPTAAEPDNPAAESPTATPVAPPMINSSPLLMMVQTSDRQMAESVWAQIDDVMVSRYRYQVETTEFDGGSVTEWISPFQGVQFSRGWLPGNVAFFAVGDGVAEAIAPSPDQPLSSTRTFQTLTSNAPRPNNGHFYIDLESINTLGGAFPLPQIPEEGPTAAIRAIGLTTEVGDRTMDYDLYVKLIKAAKTSPL